MFAKLKKKIETEVGSVESPGRTGGGLSRHSSVSSLSGVLGAGSIPRLKDGPSPPGSVTSEDFSVRDSSQRDDVMLLLQKKTEQCRKLEGNVSDLAALIKDKSKTIEKLETSLKQQEEVTTHKLQEQKAEFEKYRDKLVEGYQEEKIKLDQDKQGLATQLHDAEAYRAKYFQKEEEVDEMTGLTTQEMAKIKHLLLKSEESLKTCQDDLELKSQRLTAAENQVARLTDEMGPLKQQLATLEGENERLQEETKVRAELVTKLTKEKSVFGSRLDETNNQLTERQQQNSILQSKLSDLEGELSTLHRNFDMQRNKSNKLVQEKDDQLDSLKERVQTLEQRVTNSALSGDDMTSALQTERNGLEQRLEETRQQLTEVKSTWSDKITHLEDQISHLNAKIMEDSEELATNQKDSNKMRENFQKQVDDLKEKLDEAERRALENMELVSAKDTSYEKQLEEASSRLQRQRLEWEESESQLRVKVMTLEAQVSEVTAARGAEGREHKVRLAEREEREAQSTARETKLSQDVRELEEKVNTLQTEVQQKSSRVKNLEHELAERDEKSSLIDELRTRLREVEVESEKSGAARLAFERRLRTSEEEKGGLLDRNADLLQELHEVKATYSESKLELQRTLELKSTTVETLQKAEAVLRERVEALETQVEQSEVAQVESGQVSQRMEEMTEVIASLQGQVADKSRTIKKQEQTLKDLRVTLQRELKVQSLPNDESEQSNSPSALSNANTQRSASSNHRESSPSSRTHPQSSGRRPSQSHQPPYSNPTAAVLPMQASSVVNSSASPVVRTLEGSGYIGHRFKSEEGQEVNIQYLKHVVLKFMLSRESEALQLIKAVSCLLNFTLHEQKLIRETLEWKMSWFGNRPPHGKGQTSKVVPPTL